MVPGSLRVAREWPACKSSIPSRSARINPSYDFRHFAGQSRRQPLPAAYGYRGIETTPGRREGKEREGTRGRERNQIAIYLLPR